MAPVLEERVRPSAADDGPGRRGRRPARRRQVGFLAAVAVGVTIMAACGSTGATSVPSATTTPPPTDAAGSGYAAGLVPDATADWTTYDRTGARTGLSTSTPAFTAASHVERSWRAGVDGAVYGQPLVVGNEVVVATENNTVYALDALTGRTRWRRHLAAPVGGGLPCGNIGPSGITGTPVADAAAGRLWVVTFSADPYRHVLWSLDLRTGALRSNRDVDGPGSDPRAEQVRGALALAGGRVFVAYGGLDGDCSDYHGWVVGAPVSGAGRLTTYVTPTEREAGIWAPPGPSVGHGSLYVSTGNGTPLDAVDDSNSVVRLSLPGLHVLGTFTPGDYRALSAADQDLGSTSPVLLPDDLLLQAGKQGVAYVVAASHLGGVGGQLAQRRICPGAFGGAAAAGLTVVVSCYDGLYAVAVSPPTGRSGAGVRVLWSATGFGAGPPIIAGGVVWDATREDRLLGYSLRDGRRVYATGIDSVVTSFPTLSASRGRLFVPEGHEVVSYRGV